MREPVIRARVIAAAGAGSFAVGFSCLAVLQHQAFWTGRFDVGNLVQAVWSTAHGDFLSVTDLEGRQISRLGSHFDPLIVLFAPFWRVWPDASLLLVVQAVAVATGAIPVYRLARKHLGSERSAAGFALAYLLYPPAQWLVLDDFHPAALATPLLLACVWFLDEGRLVPFAVAAVAACAAKEHVGFAVAVLGIWWAVSHGHRLGGLAIAALAGATAVVATAVIVPYFAPGEGSPFAARYAEVGGSPAGIARTAFSDPLRLLEAMTETRDGRYLAALVLPLLALSLLAPALAAVALPELLLNLLSGTETQTSVHFHYTATIIPALIAAAVFGAAKLQSRARVSRLIPAAVVLATLVAGFAMGPLPHWGQLPLGSDLAAREHIVTRHARVLKRAVEAIPGDVPVSATNTLGAHLSERRRVFSFPVLREAEWVVVDERRPSYRDRAVAAERFRAALRAFRSDDRFRLVFSEDGVLVFRRRA